MSELLRAPHCLVLFFATSVFGLVAQSATSAAVPHYEIVPVGGGVLSAASAINNSGNVAGTVSPAPYGLSSRGFLYTPLATTEIGTHPGGTNSYAEGVNAQGQVVGVTIFMGQDNMHRAFVYSDGALRDIGTLGGTFSTAEDINDAGQVVGYSAGPVGVFDLAHAYRYDTATQTMTDLGTLGGNSSWAAAINNRGDIVGNSEYSTHSTGRHAFLYSDGTMADLGVLGGDWSTAFDINEAGQIVGSSSTSTGGSHAFLYTDGTMLDLGTLYGWTHSSAESINLSGDIVGRSRTGDYTRSRAFLHSDGIMYDLNALIPPDSRWVLESAVGINDAGQIVGTGNFLGGTTAFLLTPVPEPAAGLVAAIVVLILPRWRRLFR